MSLRLRWTLVLVAAALLLLGGVAWFLDASLREQGRSSALAWELRQENELRDRLAAFAAFAAAGVDELDTSPTLREFLVSALREGRAGHREIAGWGEERAARYGLDALMVLRADGRILTNSLWPAMHGLPHPAFSVFEEALPHAVLIWEANLPPSEGGARWFAGAARSLEFDGEKILVVGGREFSRRALTELRDRSDVARLEFGLEIAGLRLAPRPADWWLAQDLPLVYQSALDPAAEVLSAMRRRLLALTGLSLLLVLALAPWVARGLVQPLARLQTAVRQLEQGERELSIPLQGPPEVREIAGALEQLAGSLAASEARTRAAQRRAAWREMARRVAHELKNALSPLTLALDNVETAVQRDDEAARRALQTSLSTAREQLGSLDRLVSEFRDFARTPGLHFTDSEADSLVQSAIAAAREAFPSVEFTLLVPERVGAVRADAEQLRRALHNLLANAAEAAPRATVELELGLDMSRDRWWFAVRDRGPGLSEELAQHWGEPYRTSKEDGTGLGITIALQVVEGHGGRLVPRPREGGGLEVFGSLPRHPVMQTTEELQ